MKILGISGSLRVESWNTRLLQASAGVMPAGVEMTIREIGDLPHYNGDIDIEPKPPAVAGLLEAVEGADALLFATPEYNYSIPGVLKNAIDWASRPAYRSPLAHKPAGLMTAAPGPVGGARAQAHLKQVLGGTLTPVYPAPEFLVGMVAQKLDAQGRVTDAELERRLQRYVNEFIDWIQRQPASS